MMLAWLTIAAMRDAAYSRHYLVWLAFGANPRTWHLHEEMIRAVYGF